MASDASGADTFYNPLKAWHKSACEKICKIKISGHWHCGQIKWDGSAISSAKFAAQRVVVCGDKPLLYVRSLEGSKPSVRLKLPLELDRFQFEDCDAFQGADGIIFTAVTQKGEVCLWRNEADDGKLLAVSVPDHAPMRCAFSPQGTEILTYGSDGR
eukprot:scaffold118373_cov35-Prasinocladus_malaysianus.AAC.1